MHVLFKILRMTGFEPRTSGMGSNRSATSTVLVYLFVNINKRFLTLVSPWFSPKADLVGNIFFRILHIFESLIFIFVFCASQKKKKKKKGEGRKDEG